MNLPWNLLHFTAATTILSDNLAKLMRFNHVQLHALIISANHYVTFHLLMFIL